MYIESLYGNKDSRVSFGRGNWKWIASVVLTAILLSRMVHFGYVAEDKRQTTLLIEQFHKRLNNNELDKIYYEADPLFRNSLPQDRWMQLAQANRERYGAFKKVTDMKMDVIQEAPVRIRTACKADFEKGEMLEIFAFVRDGSEVRLAAYGLRPLQQSNGGALR